MDPRVNYNPGLAMVECYSKYFEQMEGKLGGLIDRLSRSNGEIKILSDVINRLSHAKNRQGDIDFSKDEQMVRWITHIHKNNPTIFGDHVIGFPEEGVPHYDNGATTVEGILESSLSYIDLSKIRIDLHDRDQINICIQGLDAELKNHTADLNEQMMKINNTYDDRAQMTENFSVICARSS